MTGLCVSVKTRANTTACVRATVVREPPGGRERRTPGVRTKNSTARNKAILNILHINREKSLRDFHFPSVYMNGLVKHYLLLSLQSSGFHPLEQLVLPGLVLRDNVFRRVLPVESPPIGVSLAGSCVVLVPCNHELAVLVLVLLLGNLVENHHEFVALNRGGGDKHHRLLKLIGLLRSAPHGVLVKDQVVCVSIHLLIFINPFC